MKAEEWFEGSIQKIRLETPVLTACNYCSGRQQYAKCFKCQGVGKIRTSIISFSIPKRIGLDDGLLDVGLELWDLNGCPINVRIELKVSYLGPLRLRNSHIESNTDVPRAILYFGGEWTVPLCGELKATIIIPPRTKWHSVLRLRGMGQLLQGGKYAEMLVRVSPKYARHLREEIEGIKLFAKLGGREVLFRTRRFIMARVQTST